MNMSAVTVESNGCTMVTDTLLSADSIKYKHDVRDSDALQIPDAPHQTFRVPNKRALKHQLEQKDTKKKTTDLILILI